MDPIVGTAGRGRAQAERSLAIAEKLLAENDFLRSKKFADRALESDPLIDGVDEILAVADVLLAAQRRINNQIDWYSVLQLDPSSNGHEPSAVKRHYRRLALLLQPDRNHSPGAGDAFQFVVDAFSVLSDPFKKGLFDSELQIAAAHLRSNSPPNPDPEPSDAFWTACPSCCHVYQYAQVYQNLTLLCPNCRREFPATELPAAPPIVPGTDMYYCSWGCFPLGFPGGPEFGDAWKPSFPVDNPSEPTDQTEFDRGKKGMVVESQRNSATPDQIEIDSGKKRKVVVPHRNSPKGKLVKTVARRRVRNKPVFEKKNEPVSVGTRSWEGTEMKTQGIDINEMAGSSEGVGDVREDVIIDLEMDAADEFLGNLPNFPFFKDEKIIQIL